MAWPKSLSTIDSNLNTTELWMLQQRMEANPQGWSVVASSGFAEFSTFVIEFTDTAEQFEFDEFTEEVCKVKKL